MTILPFTELNVEIIQEFLTKTKRRISNGADLIFTGKAQSELIELNLDYNITTDNIENAILNLTTEDYFRGIDPSGQADYEICAFYARVGEENIGIYLKYGLEANGLQILIFSNHAPTYPMNQPFKN